MNPQLQMIEELSIHEPCPTSPVCLAQMSAPQETQLLRRVAQRDHDAFACFYDQYSQPLYSFAMRVVNDPNDAEEVLQDAFVQIWEKAASFDEAMGHPFSWAVGITRNRAIDRLRAKQRRARLLAESTKAADLGESVVETHPVIVGELTAQIQTALGGLPAEQRRAIEMVFFAGLTHHEIAATLSVPVGTIKARIRRGLLQLRGCFEDAFDWPAHSADRFPPSQPVPRRLSPILLRENNYFKMHPFPSERRITIGV